MQTRSEPSPPWLAMAHHGHLQSESPWLAMASSPWINMAHDGVFTMAHDGVFTIAHHGSPWLTKDEIR